MNTNVYTSISLYTSFVGVWLLREGPGIHLGPAGRTGIFLEACGPHGTFTMAAAESAWRFSDLAGEGNSPDGQLDPMGNHHSETRRWNDGEANTEARIINETRTSWANTILEICLGM